MTPQIDYSHIRNNAIDIARSVGVPLYAVVKANAYGLGIAPVAAAIADVVAGFCVFSLAEAQQADLWNIARRPILALGPPDPSASVEDYSTAHVRPSVTTTDQAAALRAAQPAVCVETGMRRFTCAAEHVPAVLDAGDCREAFTHATRPEHVAELLRITAGRDLHLHAAGSSLMDDPTCRLQAVRPGIALYRGAVRIATRLLEVHVAPRLPAPAGYTGFLASHHGIIPLGYRHGLRPGPCLVNNARRRILEVGMQTAYVETAATDRVGDEVVLLGDSVSLDDLAAAWNVSPQQVLVSLLR